MLFVLGVPGFSIVSMVGKKAFFTVPETVENPETPTTKSIATWQMSAHCL
jgi:hypothetical protein